MLYETTVPYFIKILRNLSAILDKAEAYANSKKIEGAVLLHSRLAPDQFPLVRQVQIACDTAKLGVSRLTGKDAPLHDDKENSIPELKTRISETISYLNEFKSSDFKDAETRKITNKRWEDKYLTGQDFVYHHAIPNIYFHVTTAYSILRHNGLDIGKKDYLGEMPFQK